ncbi:CDP-alcohol phosphatidyltransferase family protein [Lentibacter sp. XHP0401]|jgi:CDP-diacylglycerol---serine O-phosphatidyltransferase|uniref:CDP-alcohol phosphatidyltransferase family protein n=1 Tax=Lentibacter sp. XHP0401 TaxID=2984334 RepID=UPI0021E7F7F0|nr:phosphatidylcholine/phosphatidylserine synthase [Lentibacter sp. XHP0401]MCV2892457.1 phosphatidylcholine/phosphatidylserine synthase [Lentibacter sp. XHP0401]
MSEPQSIKLRHIVPSVVTAFSICAGMSAIRMSLEGRIELALYFVLLAVFLDAADGKLARFLDSASPFGAELDTLADFFNFGIVPGFLLYNTLYIGTEYASLGFLATLVLAVCCALRLARFNLSMRSTEVTLIADDHFVGVPAPALACLALMPVFMHLYGFKDTDLPIVRAAYIIGVGLLAVSTIPTFSIKHASIKRSQLPFAIVAAMVLVMCLVVYPWPTLIMVNLIYLASLPFSYFSKCKHTKAMQENHANSAD